MAATPFVSLVGGLIEAMGQKLGALRPIPEGLLLRTTDGFLYAFLEDPDQISLQFVRRLLSEAGNESARLVVLSPGRIPLALSNEVTLKGATVVDGARFHELVRQLGLEALLGEEPAPAPRPTGSRLLPSAHQLDAVVHRARTWLDWGVPALGLRFYRQALDLKPEFTPAKAGIGRAYLALGLLDDAERTFREILSARPGDIEARLGEASVLGARGHPEKEIEVYQSILAGAPTRVDARAHLVAALIDLERWKDSRREVETLLRSTPEDPQLRFLHGVVLEKLGLTQAGRAEREKARGLGLTHEGEAVLSTHLKMAPPPKVASSKEAGAAKLPKARPRLERARRPSKRPARSHTQRRRTKPK